MFDPEPQSASFCIAMTDEQLTDLLRPLIIERIERFPDSGKVHFRSSFVERGQVQGKLLDWWHGWDAKQPKRPPFDLERELSKIPEPDILEMNCDGVMRRYRVVGHRLKPVE